MSFLHARALNRRILCAIVNGAPFTGCLLFVHPRSHHVRTHRLRSSRLHRCLRGSRCPTGRSPRSPHSGPGPRSAGRPRDLRVRLCSRLRGLGLYRSDL